MSNTLYKSITHCRICNSQELQPIIDLGPQPPANSLRDRLDESLPAIPLSVSRCNQCTTVQLTATVNPEYLFKNYVWVTGTSKTAKEYSVLFYRELQRRCDQEQLFVVEVASNDGTFLEPFQKGGHKVLGVDPAENIAQIANKKGITTLANFFGLRIAKKIVEQYGAADCVFARNVIPHVENVHEVIAGIAHCLNDNGTGAIEFHYSQIILDELHYDSIYHEHLCYYSLKSICYLLEMHGLYTFDVIESPISGGSLVVYFSKNKKQPTEALSNKMGDEQNTGVGTQERWGLFAQDCIRHREALNTIINHELDSGAKIIGYGASARSSTLLNFCEIDHRHLVCIADQNPLKHDKYTPGTHILIVSPEVAFSENPNVVLLLAWNFRDEVLSLLRNRYHFRGKVIQPLPNDPQLIQI